MCVCKNNSLFSNPYHRSPHCQPELSHSPLAQTGAREGQMSMNLQLHACRGILAFVWDTLGFRLICPLMLQHCNTSWRDMLWYWNKQTHGYFFPPCQVWNVFWDDFPADTTSESLFLPAHSFQSFHLESKGNPAHLSLAVVVCAGPIKESSAVRFSFFFFVF